ncbi:MAG TPA: protein kinase [Planctomycetota bacterium]|nr:protein kinase [Planctomycetota bacterium]
MPYSTDGLVGKLALQKGMISAAQLKDCLAEQAALLKAGQKRPLGVIMVSRGLMKDEDLLDLLDEQKKVLTEKSNYTQVAKEDRLFGQILLKQGVATSDEINQALRLQAEAAERGEIPVPRLGQILIQMGVTEEKAIQQTLKIQYKTLYECPGCTLKYNLVDADPHKQYRCKKCDAVLVPKPEGSGVKADESAYGLKLEIASDLPPEVAQAELDPANEFGKYVLIRPLGRGGSGVVHLAYQKELKRFVALKMLRNVDPDMATRFVHEAQLAARLRHPNIVAVYEIGKHLNVSYIALEYVEGVSLDQRGRLPYRKAAQILRDVAGALQAAHDRGIIHRDIKPQNILLSKDDRPYVTDFGLAREFRSAGDRTEKGIVVGTPAYMSVEQAVGERNLDGRSDVASLGSVLYELLTARQPYRGASQVDIALAVINEMPIVPRHLVPDVPVALEAICQKAMAKRRDDRYPTMKAFAEDLQRWLNGEPVMARPGGRVATTVRILASRKTNSLVTVAAAAAVLIAAVVSAVVWRISHQRGLLLEAQVHESSGHLTEALKIYERIPDAATHAERTRGAIRAREADEQRRVAWEKAVAVLNQAADASPSQRVLLATRAIEIFPEYEQAFVVRALADQEMGDEAAAYEDLGRAAKVSPNPLVHLLPRSEIARRTGRVEDEIENLSAALDLNPLSTDLRVQRAWALARQARALAESPSPDAHERALRALARAEADLSSVKKHSLLDTVHTAMRDAQSALKPQPAASNP